MPLNSIYASFPDRSTPAPSPGAARRGVANRGPGLSLSRRLPVACATAAALVVAEPCEAFVRSGFGAAPLAASGALTRTTEITGSDALTVRWIGKLRVDAVPAASAAASLEVVPGTFALRRSVQAFGPSSAASAALGVDSNSLSGQVRWQLRAHELHASRGLPRFSSLQRQLVDGAFATHQPLDQLTVESRIVGGSRTRYVYARPLDAGAGAHLADVELRGNDAGVVELAAFHAASRDGRTPEQRGFGGTWSMPDAEIPVSLAYVERRLARTAERALAVTASRRGWSTNLRIDASSDVQRAQSALRAALAVSTDGPHGQWSLAMTEARAVNCTARMPVRDASECSPKPDRRLLLRFSAAL